MLFFSISIKRLSSSRPTMVIWNSSPTWCPTANQRTVKKLSWTTTLLHCVRSNMLQVLSSSQRRRFASLAITRGEEPGFTLFKLATESSYLPHFAHPYDKCYTLNLGTFSCLTSVQLQDQEHASSLCSCIPTRNEILFFAFRMQMHESLVPNSIETLDIVKNTPRSLLYVFDIYIEFFIFKMYHTLT